MKRLAVTLVGGSLLLAVCILLGLGLGSWQLSWSEFLAALSGQGEASHRTVLWELRMPRTLLAAGVGACLSLSGVALQSLLRNPLADPYIVGTSAGSALGASLAMAMGLGGFAVPGLGFVGALLSIWSVFQLARRGPVLVVETFLLAGVVVSAFLGSMVSLLLTFFREELPRIVFWLMGNLSGAQWSTVGLLAPSLLLGSVGLYYHCLSLNLLTLGEESALFLGLEVEKAKRLIVVLASLMTAGAVASSGMIGFVGLVVPHAARRLVGPDHRILLPASAFAGACFLIACDVLSRLLGEIPVGILTALVGAPFFLYLLRRVRP